MVEAGLNVKYTGDASGVVEAAHRAQAAVDRYASQVESANKRHNAFARTSGVVSTSLSKIGSGFALLAKRALQTTGVLAAAGTALGVSLVRSGIQASDTLAKTSDKLGTTTQGLVGLRLAAERTGVSAATLDMGLQRMARRIGEAAIGTGEATKALNALGLSAAELNRLGPDEQFRRVAEAMKNVRDQGTRLALTQKLVDSEGVGLVNTMMLTNAEFAEFARRAEIAGVALTRDALRPMEAAKDAMDDLRLLMAGLGQQLAAQVAPAIKRVADGLFEAAEAAGGMGKVAERVFASILQAAQAASTVIDALGVAWRTVAASVLSVWRQVLVEVESMSRAAVGVLQIFSPEKAQKLADFSIGISDARRGAAEAEQKAWQEAGEAIDNYGKRAAAIQEMLDNLTANPFQAWAEQSEALVAQMQGQGAAADEIARKFQELHSAIFDGASSVSGVLERTNEQWTSQSTELVSTLREQGATAAEIGGKLRELHSTIFSGSEAAVAALRDANQKWQRESVALLSRLSEQGASASETAQRLRELHRVIFEGGETAAQLSEGLGGLTEAQQRLLDTALPLEAANRRWAKESAELIMLIGKEEKNADRLATALRNLHKAIFGTSDATKKAAKDAEDYQKALSSLLDELDPLRKAQREYADEEKILIKAWEDKTLTAGELERALDALRRKHVELFPEVSRAIDISNDLAKAWETASERIDEAFADVWKGAFDGFRSFRDSLVDGFKQMLAEMAHLAITRPILVQMGLLGPVAATVGGQAYANALGGTGGGGLPGLFAGITGAIGAGLAPLGALAGRLTPFLPGNLGGNFIGGAANFGNLFGLSGNAAIGAGVLGNVFGGIFGTKTGGLLGEALFGKKAENNIFSAIGGVAGAFTPLGPIGSFVGATIGGLLDALFGGDGKKRFNLGIVQGPGFGDRGNQVGEAVTAASGLRIAAINRRAGEEGDQAARQFLDTILALDASLTLLTESTGAVVDFANTTLAGGLADAGKTGEGAFFGLKGFNGLEGDLETAAADFVIAWLDEVNDELPQRVRRIVGGVQRTAEELVGAFEAGIQIDRLLQLDVVRSIDDALQELGRSSLGPLASYESLTDAALSASGELDDTAASFANLASVLTQQKIAAADLAVAYRAVSAQIDDILGTTLRSIEESILTPEEIYNRRRDEITGLVQALQQTTNPTQMLELVQTINQLLGSAYNLLDESQQQELNAGFVETIETVAAIVDQRIAGGIAALEASERNLAESIDFDLAAQAGQQQVEAANLNFEAATIFSSAVYDWAAILERYRAGELGVLP